MCVSSRITAGSLLTTTCNFAFSRNADSLFIRSIRRDLSFRFPQKRGNRTHPSTSSLPPFIDSTHRSRSIRYTWKLLVFYISSYCCDIEVGWLTTAWKLIASQLNSARMRRGIKERGRPCQYASSRFLSDTFHSGQIILLFYGRNCSSNFMFSRRMLVSK